MKDERIFVIAEKLDVAKKIAYAVSDTARTFDSDREIIDVPKAFDGNHYVICSAFGHLYELVDLQGEREVFPSLDIDWFPRDSLGESSFRNYSRVRNAIERRIRVISKGSAGASKLVNACDFDPEGETIGFNILQYASRGHENISWRAKFSTLTTDEIRSSFSSLFQADPNLAKAGRMRHLTDFLWGVNLSRALTIASEKSSSSTRNLTIGRVQGPALSFAVDREIDRLTHVPRPSWELTCVLSKAGVRFSSRFLDSPIRNASKAEEMYAAVSSAKSAGVKKIEKNLTSIPPRYPFDLGELQKESFRLFGLSPKLTLSIAQELYQDALISYPRTDSQKLPEKIGFSKIFQKLSLMENYGSLISKLQSDPKRRFSPWEGPNEDPAHPAIFPTGESPKQVLASAESKVYDLIVRRFCNAFSPNMIVEGMRLMFDISSFDFETKGSRILELGWAASYPFGLNLTSSLEVSLTEGEKVKVESALLDEHYDQKPERFTDSSLLSKMESEEIGTKATRGETIATLIDRKYFRKSKKELVPTEVAMNLIEILNDECPGIISVEMTRELEKELNLIRMSKRGELDFVEDMLGSLRIALTSLRKTKIQLPVLKSHNNSQREERVPLSLCPRCKSGILVLITSSKTGKRFIRCTNFDNSCNISSPAFPRGKITPTGEACSNCLWPMISVSGVNSREIMLCSNFFCKSRSR